MVPLPGHANGNPAVHPGATPLLLHVTLAAVASTPNRTPVLTDTPPPEACRLYDVRALAPTGVPLKTPVDELSTMPAGSAGVALNAVAVKFRIGDAEGIAVPAACQNEYTDAPLEYVYLYDGLELSERPAW